MFFNSNILFNCLFSRTTCVSWQSRNVGVAGASSYANHLHLTPDRQPTKNKQKQINQDVTSCPVSMSQISCKSAHKLKLCCSKTNKQTQNSTEKSIITKVADTKWVKSFCHSSCTTTHWLAAHWRVHLTHIRSTWWSVCTNSALLLFHLLLPLCILKTCQSLWELIDEPLSLYSLLPLHN